MAANARPRGPRGEFAHRSYGEEPRLSITRFQPLDPGDLLPTPPKWRMFFSRQQRNPAYLKPGDVVTTSIASEDGTLDLGTQRVAIRDAP